jgi:hypothetical protein
MAFVALLVLASRAAPILKSTMSRVATGAGIAVGIAGFTHHRAIRNTELHRTLRDQGKLVYGSSPIRIVMGQPLEDIRRILETDGSLDKSVLKRLQQIGMEHKTKSFGDDSVLARATDGSTYHVQLLDEIR